MERIIYCCHYFSLMILILVIPLVIVAFFLEVSNTTYLYIICLPAIKKTRYTS